MEITQVIISAKNREYLTKRAGSYHEKQKKPIFGNECHFSDDSEIEGQ